MAVDAEERERCYTQRGQGARELSGNGLHVFCCGAEGALDH
jgi:hypothetical protein